MIFRNAEAADIAQLVEMRIAYLKADWGSLTTQQEDAIKKQMPNYLKQHLGTGLTAYVADENGRLTGTVFMLWIEKPSGPSALNGRTGTLMNVYCDPEFRGHGIGATLVKMALEDARQKGLCHVDLQATPQGKKLYEHLGFEKEAARYTPMVFEL